MSKTPEGYVLDVIMDWLAAKHVLAFRMNTGAVKVDKRFIQFGVKGMADILAFKKRYDNDGHEYPLPVWIECKAGKGKQSEFQKSFQTMVEEYGHRYIVARGIDDLEGEF